MKTCTKCFIEKPSGEYFVKDSKTGRLHAQCKDCYRKRRILYYADHYEKYRDEYRIRAKTRRILKRAELRETMVKYLSDKACVICGESDIRTLEFDHLNPSEKSFGIARGMHDFSDWTTILDEIQKCRILCSNCHKKHTATQQNWYKII